jgi:hypothetical protein
MKLKVLLLPVEEGDRKLCLGFYSSRTYRLFLVAPRQQWMEKRSFALQENCSSAVKSEADFLQYGLQPEVGVESATERQTRNLSL